MKKKEKKGKTKHFLERITIALESIAASLAENKASPVQHTEVSKEDTPKTNENLISLDESENNSELIIKEEESPNILELFLASRGISIKVLPKEDAADSVIDSLSLFLGERYNALAPLLMKIKRAMQVGAPITESLKERAQVDVSSVCQFCTRLHEIAFLEQYQYSRSPTYLIRAKTTTLPKAQRFFGGQWLERFILQKVKEIYYEAINLTPKRNDNIKFRYLINPQIILPNKDDFELDLLISIGERIYWIEAKSGDYQQHVSKYAKFARTLGIEYTHSIMVLTDTCNEQCHALSSLFTMTVCNLASFEEHMLSIICEDIKATES